MDDQELRMLYEKTSSAIAKIDSKGNVLAANNSMLAFLKKHGTRALDEYLNKHTIESMTHYVDVIKLNDDTYVIRIIPNRYDAIMFKRRVNRLLLLMLFCILTYAYVEFRQVIDLLHQILNKK